MKITWILLLIVLLYAHSATAQELPQLFLFGNQTNEASFNLFIGSGEPRPLSLVTNEDINNLIVDPDSDSFPLFTVEVVNATSRESQAIQINTSIEFDSSLVTSNNDSVKTFVFNFADRSGPVSKQNLSIILSTLQYVANLSSDSVGETRTVRVFVYDEGDNGTVHRGLPSTATLTLQQDNIGSPVFNRSLYRVFVLENTPVNTVILTVVATDEVGPVHYELLNNGVPFSINHSSGEIYVSAPLNFEVISSYEFGVQAVDLDQFNPLTATTLVRVSINDTNDEFPVFACNPCNLTAQEEVFLPLTPIVSATDIDTVGDSLTYNFSQADYQTASQFFSINSTTGEISVIGRLDYDSPTNHRSFTFTVVAFDGALLAMTTVFISVIDREDSVPNIFPISSEVCYNLDIGTTMVVLNPNMLATGNPQLSSGVARLTQDFVSLL